MLKLTLSHSIWYYETLKPCYPKSFFLRPTLWKPSGSILSLVVIFFDKSPTWVGVYITSNRRSFIYHASMFPFMCGSRGKCWLLARPTTSTFCLSPTHFFTTLRTRFGLPYPTVAHLSWYQCGHTIYDLSTHLFQCFYKSEHTIAHDTFWDIVTLIALKNGTHVQREVSHLFLHHTWWQVDILIIKNGF